MIEPETNIWGNVQPAEVSGGVPIFRPSMNEFEDFQQYMKAVNKFGMQSGVVKVIPPKEWVESLPPVTTEALRSIKIRNPIVQHINGNNGVFGQQNIEKQRTFNIVQWKALSEEPNNQPPAPRGKVRNSSINTRLNKRILSNKNYNDEKLFENFQYNIDTSEFTPERCEALERSYWKSLTYAEPMYGADMIGSIFNDSVKVWNVAHLPNVLDYMDQKLPGVNDAYLYAGLWKATFSWHLEDQDLYSINYIHFGAPKQWYSIPQQYKQKFDEVMKDTFPQDYANCHDFLRHKTFLVSPAYLESRGVKVNKVIHNEQEFMITYPYGYHAGLNYGYNIAESVNFAIEEWFDFGLKTSKCLCVADSVGIDVERLIRRVRGEPDPIEETSPPDLVEDENQEKDATQFENSNIEEKPIKKRKIHKKATIVKEPSKPKGPQCSLCPNFLPSKQLKFNDCDLIVTENSLNGGKGHCHRICANLIPEVEIVSNDNEEEYVRGIELIPNARKKLKCVFCHVKKGACFQCSAPKCTRAFHATCALPSGVYFATENEFYCKVHRPKSEDTSSYLSSLCLGDMIQGKFFDFFAGSIASNNKSEQTLTLDVYPNDSNKNAIEIPYAAVCLQGIRFPRTVKRPKRKVSPSPSSAESKILLVDSPLEQVQLLNLKDDRYSNTVEAYEDTRWVHEFFENKEVLVLPHKNNFDLWYYKPDDSTYQIARYVDNLKVKEPNDPHSLKYYRRKRSNEEKKRAKSLPSTTAPLTIIEKNNTNRNTHSAQIFQQNYSYTPPQQIQPLPHANFIGPKSQAHAPQLNTFNSGDNSNRFVHHRHFADQL